MRKAVIAAFALLMVATFAVADDHGGPGHGGPGGGGDHGLPGGFGGGRLEVASDGTVILTRATAGSTASNPSFEIVAVRNGAVVWTHALSSVRTGIELSGAQVILVTDSTPSGATTPQTTLTALSTSTGAQAWTLNVQGRVSDLTPYSGGTYAIVTVPPTTTGGTATRSLIAISTSGTITSTVTL